jgi:biopolymer transport protein ExbD
MRFIIRKRRLPPAIIVVALIDILVVLLIFLMVATTFKQQPALRLALPESTQAQQTGAQEAPPLIVTIDKSGELRLGQGNSTITIETLRRELLAAAGSSPDLKLAISADKAAPFGQIVSVMDAAKEAKIKVVNAFTREAGR